MKRELHTPDDFRQAIEELAKLRTFGKPVTIEIKPWRPKRSTSANAYWWGCVVTPLAEFAGTTQSEMHDILCGQYFGWEEKEIFGKTRLIPRRSTTSPDKMSVADFQGLIQLGQQIAAEYGVVLPDQDKVIR